MRPLIVFIVLYAMAATAAGQPSVQDGLTGTSEVDLMKWGITQGALALVLIVVLWSYRRDFFRKIAEKDSTIDVLHEEKRMLAALIDRNTSSQQTQALALAANTQATQTLATNVDRLERSLKP